jgi:IclR family pca regulon transcriptional regulator
VNATATVLAVLEDPRYAQSLEIGLSILNMFSAEHPVLGVAEMAERLGMSRSNTNRYAITLVALGWLEQTPSRKYMLASEAARPGMTRLEEIVASTGCGPIMRRLREQTGHTVGLGVLDRTHATYVRRWHARGAGQYQADLGLRSGARVPLHCTALGKALLAGLSERERGVLLARLDLSLGGGPSAIRAKKTLAGEIERVCVGGLAIEDQEHARGVRSVAAAVPASREGLRFALEVTAPASAGGGVSRLARRVGPPLLAATEQIALRLGQTAWEDER